jgi:hypothetical protein
LKVLIRDTEATVTPNMLQATWNEVEYHLEIIVPPRELTFKFIDKDIYAKKL